MLEQNSSAVWKLLAAELSGILENLDLGLFSVPQIYNIIVINSFWFTLIHYSGHIGITVDDTYKACERFESLGVEFVKKPDDGKASFR